MLGDPLPSLSPTASRLNFLISTRVPGAVDIATSLLGARLVVYPNGDLRTRIDRSVDSLP